MWPRSSTLMLMWQNFIFRMHREQDITTNHDELPTGANPAIAHRFIDQTRDWIALVRVELAVPADDRVRELAHSLINHLPATSLLQVTKRAACQLTLIFGSASVRPIKIKRRPSLDAFTNKWLELTRRFPRLGSGRSGEW